jgi:methylated-DNA-[protein]-cysteine S-methyltransferase
MTKDYDAIILAPFGAVGIKTQDDFLVEVDLLPEPQPTRPASNALSSVIAQQVVDYFDDSHSPLEIAYAVKGTHFQKRVWQAIASIPVGQVLTYGELAEKVNSGPRAVANVCGANQVPLFIPCHRVVAKNGLGGFMQGKTNGLAIKQWLLDHEKLREENLND